MLVHQQASAVPILSYPILLVSPPILPTPACFDAPLFPCILPHTTGTVAIIMIAASVHANISTIFDL